MQIVLVKALVEIVFSILFSSVQLLCWVTSDKQNTFNVVFCMKNLYLYKQNRYGVESVK